MILGAVGLGLVAFRNLPGMLPSKLSFRDLSDPVGFRVLTAGGETSVPVFDPFIGVPDTDQDALAARADADARVQNNICAALFGPQALAPETVPVASFSDYYCPYCRTQTQFLVKMAQQDDLHLAWHELPLFGQASDIAAQAALAADLQGAYVPFHERMMGSPFRANPAYLRIVTEELGLDLAQLQDDMASQTVKTRLDDSQAIARRLGIVGTPALVVGRTIIQGDVAPSVIRDVIALERDRSDGEICKV